MSREHRSGVARVRGVRAGTTPGVTLQAIRTGVVDDMGSLWMADTFDESLATRLPTLCWAHSWSEPLGPGVGYKTGPDGPAVDFIFSDFDAVPAARRAYAQVKDGTIEDCSVGFSDTQRRDPTDAEIKRYPGVREVIYKATLDEISLVLRGAVPGAKVLSFRSRDARRVGPTDRQIDEALAIADRLLETTRGSASSSNGHDKPVSLGWFRWGDR